ncbi:hypothetical protein SGPA1_40360 [Streptomyces misionensis JCM 4497]
MGTGRPVDRERPGGDRAAHLLPAPGRAVADRHRGPVRQQAPRDLLAGGARRPAGTLTGAHRGRARGPGVDVLSRTGRPGRRHPSRGYEGPVRRLPRRVRRRSSRAGVRCG